MITNLQNLKPGTAFRVHQMPELTGLLADINECSAKVSLGRHAVEVKIGDREFTAHKSRVEIWSPATVVETIEPDAAATSPAAAEEDLSTCETCGAEVSPDHIGPICDGCSSGDEPEETTEMPKTDAIRQRRSVKTTKAKTETPAKAKPVKKANDRKVKPKLKSGNPEVSEAIAKLIEDDHAGEPKKKEHPKPKPKAGVSLLDEAAEVLADGQARSCEAIVTEVLARGKWKTAGKTPAATLYSGIIREIAAKEKESRFARGDVKGEFKIAAK